MPTPTPEQVVTAFKQDNQDKVISWDNIEVTADNITNDNADVHVNVLDANTNYFGNTTVHCTLVSTEEPRIVLTDDSTITVDFTKTASVDRNNTTLTITDLDGNNHVITKSTIKEAYILWDNRFLVGWYNGPTLTHSLYGHAFSNCVNLVKVGFAGDNHNITDAGNNFANAMFSVCTSLTNFTASFNLPQSITSCGYGFCQGMFSGCPFSRLPNNFNLPPNLATVGNLFATYMFQACNNLVSIPNNFEIPNTITTFGDQCMNLMFDGCSALTSDIPNIPPLHIPDVTHGSGYCTDMFRNCPVNGGANPTPGQDILIKRNS